MSYFTHNLVYTHPHTHPQYTHTNTHTVYSRGVKLIFTRGHISLTVAFKGLNVILRLYKRHYSLTVKGELGTAAGKKQGAGPDKTRWRAGFHPQALCLPPVVYSMLIIFKICLPSSLFIWLGRKGANILMIQFINHDPSVTNYLISGKCYNPNERCYFRGTEAQVSQNLSQDLIYAANFKQL